MTMEIKVVNEDTDPSRKAKVQVVNIAGGGLNQGPFELCPGDSKSLYIHKEIKLEVIELDADIKAGPDDVDTLKEQKDILHEDKSISVEAYGSGFMLADYSGKRGVAAFCGLSMNWGGQPVIDDPFPTEEAALKAGLDS